VSDERAILQFPCAQCGARLTYAPGTDSLACGQCQHSQPVPPGDPGPIREYPLAEGLAAARRANAHELDAEHQQVRCDGCGASFAAEQARRCPYCASPVVVVHDEHEDLVPESVLPFSIARETARTTFRRWVRSRWFAPNDFSLRARKEGMDGVYLPYWTYDAQAQTRYSGQRGEWYYVTETYRDSEGNTKTRQVRKTRWYPAAGSVHDAFDDVPVCASRSLPTKLVDTLEPWDLHDLRAWSEGYLAGFSAERYAVEVGEGFDHGRERTMVPAIRRHVRSDIGGDEQRITHLQPNFSDVRFKLTLLPLWIASFRYRDRVFRFVVNGRTGEASGERPWSAVKITFAVIGGLLALGTLLYLISQN